MGLEKPPIRQELQAAVPSMPCIGMHGAGPREKASSIGPLPAHWPRPGTAIDLRRQSACPHPPAPGAHRHFTTFTAKATP
ncbi:hypothetical protein CK620_02195 [Vandammella animalimorsus]|uniref:Uncharacterized protein n=1 Tax=Vandammella animalimorsus TaxID=2029117 RepID=A0A2A2AEA1_9BURK|nr:hypothetical protein CK620_02195 [Vandammella animalimorsus]